MSLRPVDQDNDAAKSSNAKSNRTVRVPSEDSMSSRETVSQRSEVGNGMPCAKGPTRAEAQYTHAGVAFSDYLARNGLPPAGFLS